MKTESLKDSPGHFSSYSENIGTRLTLNVSTSTNLNERQEKNNKRKTQGTRWLDMLVLSAPLSPYLSLSPSPFLSQVFYPFHWTTVCMWGWEVSCGDRDKARERDWKKWLAASLQFVFFLWKRKGLGYGNAPRKEKGQFSWSILQVNNECQVSRQKNMWRYLLAGESLSMESF